MGQPVVQFQILARNPDALTAFYAKLFGWQVNADNAMGYRTDRARYGRLVVRRDATARIARRKRALACERLSWRVLCHLPYGAPREGRWSTAQCA
jgi:hypothetical protein